MAALHFGDPNSIYLFAQPSLKFYLGPHSPTWACHLHDHMPVSRWREQGSAYSSSIHSLWPELSQMAIPNCKVHFEIYSLLQAVVCPAKNWGKAILQKNRKYKLETIFIKHILSSISAVLWKCYVKCLLICSFILKIVSSSDLGLQVQIITS